MTPKKSRIKRKSRLERIIEIISLENSSSSNIVYVNTFKSKFIPSIEEEILKSGSDRSSLIFIVLDNFEICLYLLKYGVKVERIYFHSDNLGIFNYMKDRGFNSVPEGEINNLRRGSKTIILSSRPSKSTRKKFKI